MVKRALFLWAAALVLVAVFAWPSLACGDPARDGAASTTTIGSTTSATTTVSPDDPDSSSATTPTSGAQVSVGHPTSTTLRLSFTSREGREIGVILLGSGQPVTLILAGIHGDEPQSVELARLVVRRLAQDPPAPGRGTIAIAPCINPDGMERGTRKNAGGVDVNRNFPTRDFGASEEVPDPDGRYYGGEAPASEPETRAILDLIAGMRPDLVLTLHAPLACVNYDGPAVEEAGILAKASGLPLEPEIGYSTPGSLGTYLGKERDIPVITLELGTENDVPQLADALMSLLLR